MRTKRIGTMCFTRFNRDFLALHAQKYDPELFKMAMPCLSAIAGALPPDYVDASISTAVEKPVSVDAQGNFDPKPISTAK